MAILESRKLGMNFGSLAALNDVDLQVSEGALLGLIGPNGAGKTTLFNCLTGYLTASRGAIHFRDREITRSRPFEICHMGICRTFQIVQSFQEMTVLENVMMGAFCRHPKTRDCMDKAVEVLEFTGLAAKKNEIAGSLTLADQKRIELSRALATEPTVLLLDEVMAGLNPTETEKAAELVEAIHERGLTVIVVEHVMEIIMKISHRIVVFDSGELIADGPPDDVVHNDRVIQAYLGEEYHA